MQDRVAGPFSKEPVMSHRKIDLYSGQSLQHHFQNLVMIEGRPELAARDHGTNGKLLSPNPSDQAR
jgi:hypothetical protein